MCERSRGSTAGCKRLGLWIMLLMQKQKCKKKRTKISPGEKVVTHTYKTLTKMSREFVVIRVVCVLSRNIT